ncbi:hypothetical protein E4U41_001928, partial [Claviceps citrina]
LSSSSSSSSSSNMYSSLEAARASRKGAFITAWPADEPYFAPPSTDQLKRELARPSRSQRSHTGGVSSRFSAETLSHLPAASLLPGE